jgi:hypothetical protein
VLTMGSVNIRQNKNIFWLLLRCLSCHQLLVIEVNDNISNLWSLLLSWFKSNFSFHLQSGMYLNTEMKLMQPDMRERDRERHIERERERESGVGAYCIIFIIIMYYCRVILNYTIKIITYGVIRNSKLG